MCIIETWAWKAFQRARAWIAWVDSKWQSNNISEIMWNQIPVKRRFLGKTWHGEGCWLAKAWARAHGYCMFMRECFSTSFVKWVQFDRMQSDKFKR